MTRRALRDFCQAASDLAFENLMVGIALESGLPQTIIDTPDQKEALGIIRDMQKYDIQPNVDIVMSVLTDRYKDYGLVLKGAYNAATSRIERKEVMDENRLI